MSGWSIDAQPVPASFTEMCVADGLIEASRGIDVVVSG